MTQIPHLSLMNAHVLIESMGTASAVFENRKNIRDFIPDATDSLLDILSNINEPIKRAEAEFEEATRKNIQCISYNDPEYPLMLRQCPDAPLVLFYFGNKPINRQRMVAMVGTRNCTQYGKDIIRSFITDISKSYPDTLIVSGLAYGIDVNCHRQALECGMDTVGVVAHGLDTIYPSRHRQIASRMCSQGGILTEYMLGTKLMKGNFIRRNRIVAGMCTSTIVIESAAKGGALITARLASDYNREVFAFPGNIYNQYSEGCNKLISNGEAHLIQSASDFMRIMGWEEKAEKPEAIELELFPELSHDEKIVVDCLKDVDSMQINKISIDTNLSYSQVSSILFELEVKGLVAVLGGARYRLIRR